MLYGGGLRILSVSSASLRTNLLKFFGRAAATTVPEGRDCLNSLSMGV